jgi:maleylacetoacetate isomerase
MPYSHLDRPNCSAYVFPLVEEKICLTQSIAILEYLEESGLGSQDENAKLLPADPVARARVRAIVQIIASDTQPLQNLRVLQHPLVGNDNKMEWGRHWIDFSFQALEKTLQTTAGRFCVGDKVTFADICLVPQVLIIPQDILHFLRHIN